MANEGSDDRTWMWFVGGVFALVLVAVVVGALLGPSQPAARAAAAPSPSTEPSPSVVPTATVTEAAPVPAWSPYGLLDDGIATKNYPPEVTIRNAELAPARLMEPWVWEHVGPGWSVVSYSEARAVVDLVSPEGVHFQLVKPTLPPGTSNLQIKTWLEDSRHARVSLVEGDGSGIGIYLLDLETGSLEPWNFELGATSSVTEEFIGSTADGVELWQVTDTEQVVRLFRWTPSSGWDEALPEDDYFTYGELSASPSGELAVFSIYDSSAPAHTSERSGEPGTPNFLLYDLSKNTSTVVSPGYLRAYTACFFEGWLTEEWFRFSCRDDVDAGLFAVAPDGETRKDPPSGAAWTEEGEPLSVEISGIRFSGDATIGYINRVEVETTYDPAIVLQGGVDFSTAALRYRKVIEVANGIYRIDATGTSMLVDPQNAVGTVVVEPSGAWVTGVAGYMEPGSGETAPYSVE